MKNVKTVLKQGLVDPAYEQDACGMGFVVNILGTQSHEIVDDARRGQSMIVWAIHEGKRVVWAVDRHLMGSSKIR